MCLFIVFVIVGYQKNNTNNNNNNKYVQTKLIPTTTVLYIEKKSVLTLENSKTTWMSGEFLLCFSNRICCCCGIWHCYYNCVIFLFFYFCLILALSRLLSFSLYLWPKVDVALSFFAKCSRIKHGQVKLYSVFLGVVLQKKKNIFLNIY